MRFYKEKIRDVLLRGNYISKKDLEEAEKSAKEQKIGLIDYLLNEKLITSDLLGQAISEVYKISYADLNSLPPSPETVLRIPEKIGLKHRVVIFKESDKEIVLATDDPVKADTFMKKLKELFKGKSVKLAYGLPEDIDTALLYYRKDLVSRLNDIIKGGKNIAPEMIREIIKDAIILRASDIHFEPQEGDVIIRYRIDGVMQEVGRMTKEYYDNVLNRVKVLSHMRLDDHFSAQDGAIRFKSDSKIIDLRVSVAPTLDGEKVVIRILAEYIRNFNLEDLGLSSNSYEVLVKASKKPFGMILVTGPTGSGKTTTLYALLKVLNQPGVNITTIEDPVEYKIPGVNQIQVNPQTNLTFVKGLKSIVRQDPDVILVGEIRDDETGEIAVNAALTGHLLFSTFHANDSATSIPRLLDMNIEPFLLASTLELIIAQRLVRRICQQCRHSVKMTQAELMALFPEARNFFGAKSVTLYKGKGCKSCGGTGYRGRIGIFEYIDVGKEMKELILTNPSAAQVWRLARSKGTRSLFEDGIDKVKNGITTLEELLRVASPREE